MESSEIVARLSGVRRTGNGRWTARCPAHEDRHASLSIRELMDGRILMHCFADCPVRDVLRSVGLSIVDRYPDAASFHLPKVKGAFSPLDVLRAIAFESLIAATISSNLRKEMVLSSVEHDRLWVAATRLQAACEVADGE